MPRESFLHERNDFKALIEAVAHSEQINDPGLVGKDYWIMHALFGLRELNLTFQLKGGTSLSKGFGIIDRFSEDIDIRIEPFDGLKFDDNPNHDKPQPIESRREFFEKLRQKINIPGIIAVERDRRGSDRADGDFLPFQRCRGRDFRPCLHLLFEVFKHCHGIEVGSVYRIVAARKKSPVGAYPTGPG